MVTVDNNATGGGAAVLLLQYDNYPPNNNQNVVGAYPVIPGQQKTASIPASFIPGKFVITVDGDTFGYIELTGSDSVTQTQNYTGAISYTFTGVVVNNSQDVLITVADTTTTTTTSTTTTTTSSTTTTTTTI